MVADIVLITIKQYESYRMLKDGLVEEILFKIIFITI